MIISFISLRQFVQVRPKMLCKYFQG